MERHKVGEEWIEVPNCILAQGGPSVETFLALLPAERAKEVAGALAADQARVAAARKASPDHWPVNELVQVITPMAASAGEE